MVASEWQNTAAVLNDYAQKLIKAYREELEREKVNASWKLSNNLSYNVNLGTQRFTVSIRLEDYWKYVEYGRKPGKWPPIAAIKEWIIVKPVVPEVRNGRKPTVAQLAYLIARKIGTQGIAPRPIFKTAFDGLLDGLYKDLNEAVKKDVTGNFDIKITK